MPIREEAINVFMGLPGDGDRLELTYNHGVDSYELGTGYNHIALTVERPRRHARAARRPGHRAGEAALPGARGRLADLLRARPGRLSHRADRALAGHERPAPGGHRPRVELVPPRRVHVGQARRPRLVAAHGRDLRGGARRRRARRRRRAAARADGAGARDDRAVRALLPRDRDRRRPPRRHLGDPRRHQPEGLPAPGAQALGARDRGALARGGGPLRLSRRGQLDDALRRRRARPRRRLDAADPRRGAPGARRPLVAARRGPHDRALPGRRQRQAQAAQGAARAHLRRAGDGGLAQRGRRGRRAPRGHRRHGAQPRGRGGDRRRQAVLRRPGLPARAHGARRRSSSASPT